MQEKRGEKKVELLLPIIVLVVTLAIFVFATAPNSPSINAPQNNTFTNINWTLLNFSVTDPDAGDNITAYIYASNSSNGLINNSRNLIYKNTVANGTQIIYNLTALPIDHSLWSNGLVALWHFDNMSEFGENDTNVYEFANKGVFGNGTILGNVSWNSSGKFAGAYQFSGINGNCINTSIDNPLDITGNLTISAWIYVISNKTANKQIVTKLDVGATSGPWGIYLSSTNNLTYLSSNSVLAQTDTVTFTNVSLNEWNHIVFVRNQSSSNVTFYINGIQDSMGWKFYNASYLEINSLSAKIGCRADNLAVPFNGSIDDMAIWNRTLSSVEIQSLYQLQSGKYYWQANVSDGSSSILSNINIFDINYSAINNITINYPVQYAIYQRHNSTTGQIPIYGTYSYLGSPPNAIEASFNGGSFVNISVSPSNGVFNGYLNASVGNGTLIIRFSENSSVNYSLNNIGIGDVFVVGGQSNARDPASIQSLSSSNNFLATAYLENDTWKIANDPIYVTTVGSAWPLVANYIIQNQSIPIAFIPTAISGSNITTWQKGNVNYDNMTNQITEATNGSMNVKTLLFFQGETDYAAGGFNGSYDLYKSALFNLSNSFINDTNIATKILIGQIDVARDAFPFRSYNIRKAQQDSWYENNNISRGAITYDISTLADNLHFSSDSEIQSFSKRWWTAIGDSIYGLSDLRPPKLANISLWTNSTTSNLTLTFNETSLPLIIENYNGSVTGTFAYGWRILDGTNIYEDANITSTTVNNNTLIIQLPFVLTANANITYGYSNYSYDKTVLRDNSTFRLPIDMIFESLVNQLSETTAPLVNITFPQNITYSINVSQLNYTYSDTNPGVCWYSKDNGLTNSSTQSPSINFTNVISIEGSNTWKLYCNDSFGNLNTSSITFFKDTTYPLIEYGIGTASNNFYSNKNWTYVNVTVTEERESTITFLIYNSTGQVNLTSYINQARTINWTNLIDGTYYYNVTVNDTLGNTNTTQTRVVVIDTINPSISNISSPLNITYTTSNILFNISTNENSTCNYTLDSGITNSSMTANSTGTGFTATQTLSNSNYLAKFYCWDLSNNLNNSEIVNFSVSVASSSSTTTPSSSVGTPIVTHSATETQIQEGYTNTLGINSKINFNIGGESHVIKLTRLTSKTATINVSSNKNYLATFSIGDARKFELNGDNFYDLFVKLNSIKNSKANFTIQLIHESITPETIKEEQKKEEQTEQEIQKEIKKKITEKLGEQKYLIISFLIVLTAIIFILVNSFRRKKRRTMYGF